MLSNLTMVAGCAVSPTAFDKNGEDWCRNHPVGTGPFEFVSWERDKVLKYKKFNNYWMTGKPYLDGLEYYVIADNTTRQMSLRRGEIDVAHNLDLQDIKGLEKDGFVITRLLEGGNACSTGLVPDSANPKSPFADIRVRQATAYAIDQEGLVAGVLMGEGAVSNQYTFKGQWGYNPDVVGYPYNPDKAKKLLADAGYPMASKPILCFPLLTKLLQLPFRLC